MLGVTYTNVSRHVTEGRAELRDLRGPAGEVGRTRVGVANVRFVRL
jgi:hypothetical protein